MPFVPMLIDAHNPGPMTGSGNNTYLLFGGTADATLVDAGVGEARHLDALAHELEHRATRLTRVIATHGHRDHVAGAPEVARRHPDAVFAKYAPLANAASERLHWRTLAEGDVIDVGGEGLTVLHTPGHAPDHIALWHAPTRAAFVGDLVIQGRSVMIHSSGGGNMRDYLASLERLVRLKPRILYPAHGAVIAEPLSVLSRHIAHRLERERQVMGAVRRGCSTVSAIADSIYDGLEPALRFAADENVRAHLEKLKADGVVIDEDDRWSHCR